MQVVDWLQRRWDANVSADMRSYPWWLDVGTTLGTISLAIGAVAQRGGLALTWQVALGGVLAVAPSVAQVARGWQVPPLVVSAAMLVAVGLLLSRPVPTADLAPFLLVVLGAEVTAVSQPLIGLAVTVASGVLLIVMATFVSLPGVGIYVVGVCLGFDVGYTLRWQKRALEAERARNLVERRQATFAERQRIAREIHDVVAHSLSVTLLHVTGARRALQTDRDVDDAVAALTDAEQVGRQAMADIRRTVGLLSADRPDPAPLPGIADIAHLVQTLRAAGLQVDYRLDGDAAELSPATGLGLYRIVQESLSNVAKHAPKQAARVRLHITGGTVDLTIRNGLPAEHRTGTGSGIPGMAARAGQFGGVLDAGPDGDVWRVRLRAPAPQEEPHEHQKQCIVKAVTGDRDRP
jgi:signal transduction histidine kinase